MMYRWLQRQMVILGGIFMFGIGMSEILLILVIALIVLGPQKLPEVARFIGKALNEIRRATNEIKASMDVDSGLKDIKKSFSEMNSGYDPSERQHSDPQTPPVSPTPPSGEAPASQPSDKQTHTVS